MNRQHGQTLIETMVALFIMTMGITAALGLANYSFSASSNISNQVIGIGLAREYIEAFKNMRDTNWLIDSLSTDCYNHTDGSATAPCYRNWQNPPGGYNLSVPTGSAIDSQTGFEYTFFNIDINPLTPQLWTLAYFDPNVCTTNKYTVDFDPNATRGWFYTPALCDLPGTSNFHRQLSVQKVTAAPFNQDTGPMLDVLARVWWAGRNCPISQTFNAARRGCRVELRQYLTNWKTY